MNYWTQFSLWVADLPPALLWVAAVAAGIVAVWKARGVYDKAKGKYDKAIEVVYDAFPKLEEKVDALADALLKLEEKVDALADALLKLAKKVDALTDSSLKQEEKVESLRLDFAALSGKTGDNGAQGGGDMPQTSAVGSGSPLMLKEPGWAIAKGTKADEIINGHIDEFKAILEKSAPKNHYDFQRACLLLMMDDAKNILQQDELNRIKNHAYVSGEQLTTIWTVFGILLRDKLLPEYEKDFPQLISPAENTSADTSATPNRAA